MNLKLINPLVGYAVAICCTVKKPALLPLTLIITILATINLRNTLNQKSH